MRHPNNDDKIKKDYQIKNDNPLPAESNNDHKSDKDIQDNNIIVGTQEDHKISGVVNDAIGEVRKNDDKSKEANIQ